MEVWTTLLVFLTLGWVGSPHCAGMCGGFAVAVAAASPAGGRAQATRQICYVMGKATSYGVLGLLASSAAHLVSAGMGGVRGTLALLVGLSLILVGLGASGLRLPLPAPAKQLTAAPARLARTVWRGASSLPGTSGALGLGLVNGLLPCGLSFAAIALASTAPHWAAFLGPFAFGLATAPILALTAVGWRFSSQRWRRAARALAGPLLVILGVWTCARGGELFEGLPGSCCAQPAQAPDAP